MEMNKMKPDKRKAKLILIRKIKKDIDECFDKIEKIFSGDYDEKLEISKTKDGKKYYINIPCVAWDFIDLNYFNK